MTLLRGRALALLPFLLPFISKRKKSILFILGLALSYPMLRNLFNSMMNKVDVNNSNLRYEDVYYETIAQESHEIMNGHTTNSEEDSLLDLVRDLNSDELKAVFNAFGMKRYATNGDPVFIPFFYKEKNLFGWYQEELDSDDYQEMKKIWSKTDLWKN